MIVPKPEFCMCTDKSLQVSLPSRREFVQTGVGLSAAGLAAMASVNNLLAADRQTKRKSGKSLIQSGDTILFQGDSITDAGRKRDVLTANSDAGIGRGYAWLVAAQLLINRPDANLKIFNRGNSGNKVYQLAERWEADCLDLKPDVLSILIGVNDFWHTLDGSYKATVEKYESDYQALVKRTKAALPNLKLVICEPFSLKAGKVNGKWFPGFDGYRAAAKRVADESGAVFVPFQTMFDAASKIAPPALWAADGVHPTCDGAAIMASFWLKAVGASLA
jgi:lysophospholipase L1-like esterase